MAYLPGQQANLSTQDAQQQLKRETRARGKAGTVILARRSAGGDEGYLTIDAQGRVVDWRQGT